jgi:hypothetical protein
MEQALLWLIWRGVEMRAREKWHVEEATDKANAAFEALMLEEEKEVRAHCTPCLLLPPFPHVCCRTGLPSRTPDWSFHPPPLPFPPSVSFLPLGITRRPRSWSRRLSASCRRRRRRRPCQTRTRVTRTRVTRRGRLVPLLEVAPPLAVPPRLLHPQPRPAPCPSPRKVWRMGLAPAPVEPTRAPRTLTMTWSLQCG